ncbi:beta-carotene 15,15'-dioxygenase, Brp/Blh family [Aquiluna sp. Uisw_065]|uniref:beta-carotene 15,15'-dioxygenase, Brp/Blh family n=1 Tax=Aquiluna sp. Uisw_065 TaxID=3230967 RepID=UPI0039EBF5C1
MMVTSEIRLMKNLRAFSRYCILFGILASLVFLGFGGLPIGWQVALALIALTVGIPHGAADHIISVPKFASGRMALFLIGYLSVVGVAIWAILSANLLGFQIVVLMSAIHFGIGDAAFISELDARKQNKSKFPKVPYIIASGFTPVVIPLSNSESAAALNEVNPALVNWAGSITPLLFSGLVTISLVSIIWMLVRQRKQEALDLGLLLVLALVAPPLVAFAFYFGFWHALRHTGRLSLELKTSAKLHELGKPMAALGQAIWAGVPALFIVIVFTVVLGLVQGFEFGQDLLWYLLVVIWALTVPHMALTLRLDIKALRPSDSKALVLP